MLPCGRGLRVIEARPSLNACRNQPGSAFPSPRPVRCDICRGFNVSYYHRNMALGPQHRISFSRMTSSDSGDSSAQRSPQHEVARLAELRAVHDAFTWFRVHGRELEDLQLEVTAIPAPPWGEAARAEWLRGRFEALGLADVHHDELCNVFGVLPGTDADAPYIALSAHLDTVFPAGTPISVKRRGRKTLRPGHLRQRLRDHGVTCHRDRTARGRHREHARRSCL